MSEPTNESDEQLQRMLRRWGAEEAVRNQNAAEALRESGHRPLLRWLPTAVAAGLLLAATVILFMAGRQQQPRGDATDTAATGQIRKLQVELAELREDLLAARNRAESAQGRTEQLVEQQEDYRRQVAELRERLLLRDEQADELSEQLAVMRERFNAAAEQNEQLRDELAELSPRLVAAMQDLEQANRQARELRDAHAELQTELSRLETRQTALWEDFQRAYLGWFDRRIHLGVRQRAVESNRLLQRAGGVRRLAGAAETAELIDCIEVILTRLMTLPANDPAAEEALSRLIEDTECLPRINTVLAGRRESQAVRAWLTEAKLVLMGVGHVG